MLLLLDEVEAPLHIDESRGGEPVLPLHLGAPDAQQCGDPVGADALREDRRPKPSDIAVTHSASQYIVYRF
ncbi:hypothetical protein [Microbacterium sp. MMO-113]|uniref:hypothetical protein n=1 Tax=Microbacterium sp. MMO-113 TaxID=3081273 RepID=UPI00301809EC